MERTPPYERNPRSQGVVRRVEAKYIQAMDWREGEDECKTYSRVARH